MEESKPMQPSSGDSMEGVMTSIFIAASMVFARDKAEAIQLHFLIKTSN